MITKGTNIGFMSQVTTQEKLVTCKNVVIAITITLEPTRLKIGELASPPSGLGTIYLDDRYHTCINP